METIANDETEQEAVADNDLFVTIRCAPRFNGEVREVRVPRRWELVAEKLVRAGEDRAIYSSARGEDGSLLRRAAWEEIRTIWDQEARPLGMSQVLTAKLVGLSRAQLDSILRGKVGGQRYGA